MAYGKRLYMDFDDDLGTTWTVEIYDNNYAGAATELDAMGDPPVVVRWNGDKDKTIVGSEALISIVGTDDMSWLDASTGDDVKIIIKKSGITWWTGYAVAGQYIDEFTDTQRFLIITANDRIGMLDNILYQTFDSPPVKYTGYETALIQIVRCLNHTNIDLNLVIYDNLFESGMNTADTDDPYPQYSINQNIWLDQDQNPKSCTDVLNGILGVRDARIFQSRGKWIIQRRSDITLSSVDYREFTNQGVYVGELSADLQVSTDDELTLMNGCQIEYTDGWKNRIINSPHQKIGMEYPVSDVAMMVWSKYVPLLTPAITPAGSPNRTAKIMAQMESSNVAGKRVKNSSNIGFLVT